MIEKGYFSVRRSPTAKGLQSRCSDAAGNGGGASRTGNQQRPTVFYFIQSGLTSFTTAAREDARPTENLN
jgi:hypothetical protein